MFVSLVLLQHLLRYQYTESTVVEYDVRQSWETMDYEEMSVYIEKWKYSVTKMLNGGSSQMSVERLLVGMEIDDEPIKISEGSPTVSDEDHSTRGDVKRKTRLPGATLMSMRLARIGDLFYPVQEVSVGGSWQREQSTDESGGLPPAKWTWTLDEVKEGKASGRFSFIESWIESPVQAEGKFVISLKDGWPLELSFKAINTYQSGDEERLPTIYEFSMKRR